MVPVHIFSEPPKNACIVKIIHDFSLKRRNVKKESSKKIIEFVSMLHMTVNSYKEFPDLWVMVYILLIISLAYLEFNLYCYFISRGSVNIVNIIYAIV